MKAYKHVGAAEGKAQKTKTGMSTVLMALKESIVCQRSCFAVDISPLAAWRLGN